jgi:hypothetical protein
MRPASGDRERAHRIAAGHNPEGVVPPKTHIPGDRLGPLTESLYGRGSAQAVNHAFPEPFSVVPARDGRVALLQRIGSTEAGSRRAGPTFFLERHRPGGRVASQTRLRATRKSATSWSRTRPTLTATSCTRRRSWSGTPPPTSWTTPPSPSREAGPIVLLAAVIAHPVRDPAGRPCAAKRLLPLASASCERTTLLHCPLEALRTFLYSPNSQSRCRRFDR